MTTETEVRPGTPHGVRTRRLLLVACVVGIGGELAIHNTLLHGAPWGAGFALSGVAAAAAVSGGRGWVGMRPGRSAWLLAMLAAVFSVMVAWRAAPELAAANVLAAASLLIGAVYLYRGRRLAELSLAEYLLAAYRSLIGVVGAPARFASHAARGTARLVPRLGRFRPVVRGLAIAALPLAVFAVLFASADAVFADLAGKPFSVRLSFGGLAAGAVVAAGFTWIALGSLWYAATHDDYPEWDEAVERPSLGRTEAVTLLSAVNLLFLAFVAIQFAYLFGGQATVTTTGGLTYAEYARQGFFQLLVVAGLAVGLILAVDYLVNARRARSRLVDRLHLMLIGLTGVVLVSAVVRLDGYIDEFGLSKLRLYAFAMLVWVAWVLGWIIATVVRARRSRFPIGAFLGGLVVLAALNVANPDARIATVNLDRQLDGGRQLDVYYVTANLSEDAVPVLVDGIAALAPCDGARLADWLLAAAADEGGGWRSYNVGRHRADRLLADLAQRPDDGC